MAEINYILEITGGLSLILYGIHLSGVNIQKMLGSRLEEVLKKAGKDPLRGVATGAVITGAINSSGTTTVILLGLITGGVMSVASAAPIMMGASVGSTVVTQLASMGAGIWGLALLPFGVFIHLSAKRKLIKNVGEALIGLSFIFAGMWLLFAGVEALAGHASFLAVTDALFMGAPLLSIAAGVIITLLLQSATAASIFAVALGAAGVIDLPAALFLILGINLGSSFKVVYLALRGENFSGRLAFIHLLFNLTGLFFALLFFPLFLEITRVSASSAGRQIANAHLLYNLASAFLFLPLIPAAVRISQKASARVKTMPKQQLAYLDEKLISTPSVSLAQVNRGAVEMAKISFEMLESSRAIFFDGKTDRFGEVELQEDKIDMMTEKMTEYTIWISQQNLSHADKMKLFRMLHVLADIEHLTDHILAVSRIFIEMEAGGVEFSEKAQRDLTAVFGKLKIMQNLATKALEEENPKLAAEITIHENKVDEIIKKVAAGHEKRLEEGVCSPAAGKHYMDILYNLERIGDYYDDIAFAINDSLRDARRK